MKKLDPLDPSFWLKVERRDPDECWPWLGTQSGNGYGQVKRRPRKLLAHRIAYVLTFGDLPDGMMVCHRCDNPLCCNPAHLFAGDGVDNMRDMVSKGRGWNQRKTHCPRGHPLAGENLQPAAWRRGLRECRTCNNARARLRKQVRREAC